jgi:hypothetical protein
MYKYVRTEPICYSGVAASAAGATVLPLEMLLGSLHSGTAAEE